MTTETDAAMNTKLLEALKLAHAMLVAMVGKDGHLLSPTGQKSLAVIEGVIAKAEGRHV